MKSTTMKALALAAALVGLAFASVSAHADENCYSSGVRVGTVQKFAIKGVINKSWEGELVTEGVKVKTDAAGKTAGGNIWYFSVLDRTVAKAIDDATMSGGSVALRYCQLGPLSLQTLTDTPYRITQAVLRQ